MQLIKILYTNYEVVHMNESIQALEFHTLFISIYLFFKMNGAILYLFSVSDINAMVDTTSARYSPFFLPFFVYFIFLVIIGLTNMNPVLVYQHKLIWLYDGPSLICFILGRAAEAGGLGFVCFVVLNPKFFIFYVCWSDLSGLCLLCYLLRASQQS